MKKKKAKPTSLRRFVKAVKAKAAPAKDVKLYRIPRDVIDRITQLGGHTISRTMDGSKGGKGVSVATCQCGVTIRAERTLPYAGENVIAAKEEAHWRDVLRRAAKELKLQPIAPALASLVREASGPGAVVSTIDPKRIIIGTRHRKEMGDLKGLARSIDDRGGLIQPIALKPNRELIAGERRIKAWALSRYAGQPIPCHYLDIDAIVAGEWDENAQRKDFTHSEAVKIMRTLKDVLAKLQASRPKEEKAAPGRKASGLAAGDVAAKAARIAGVKRSSMYKAEAVVAAAEENPALFGDLQAEMDRTGKVNAPFQKLTIRRAKRALNDAPPALPMHGPYDTVAIDYPWPHEGEDSQASIDKRDRSLRPYPAMAIAEGVKFMCEQVAPLLAAKCVVWFWVPNFHLVRGYHAPLIEALGLRGHESTNLTWVKDKLGRGRVLRDKTEQCFVIVRGKALLDIFGKNPPTTELRAPRDENSRKPKKFYQLVERVSPAKRYAEIFSTGAHGRKNWDCHGDQVGKFARAA